MAASTGQTQPQKLCNKCSEIALAYLWPDGIVFHNNLQSLVGSAKDCAFCTLCWVQIQRDWSSNDVAACLEPKPGDETRIFLQGEWHPRGLVPNASNRVYISVGEVPGMVGDGSTGRFTHLDLFTEPGTAADAVLYGRYITPDRNPNLYIDEAKRWLAFCRSRHSLCNRVKGASATEDLPKRLIFTGSPGDPPRLVVSSALGSVVPYVALSYCWGAGVRHAVELRDQNLSALLKSLPEAQLTRTHQESMAMTRALGFSYLWVDSLCIIQGNAADWEAESKRMAAVYSGAELTIIASRAADSRDGFVANKTQASLPPPVAMPFGKNPFTGAGDLGTVHLALTRKRAPDGPLDTRAWCYQEGLLSARPLRVATEQVMFRCRTADCWEDGEVNLASDREEWAFLLGGPDPGTRDEVLRRWYRAVGEFSLRDVTEPHDVFACVASVAIIVGRVAGGRYLAGLWEVDMPRGLMWRARWKLYPRSEVPLAKPRASGLRPGEKKGDVTVRAPSWSWAGLLGPVVWAGPVRTEKRYTDRANWCVRPRKEGRWTPRTDVGEHDRLYMRELELQVWGRPLRVRLLRASPADYAAGLPPKERYAFKGKFKTHGTFLRELSVPPSLADGDPRKVKFIGLGYLDIPSEAAPAELWCLRVIREEGLLLVRDAKGKFRRVGYFLVSDEKPFLSVSEAAVDLV